MTAPIDILFDGEAEGELLKLGADICFWGGLDPATGLIADPHHPEHGQCVTGKVLALPRIVGSSSSSQILLELLLTKKGPAAIILGEAEAIIAMAVLVGREMGYDTIPILQTSIKSLVNGSWLTIGRGGHLVAKNRE